MKGDVSQKRTRSDRSSPIPQTLTTSQKRKSASSSDANSLVTDDEVKDLNSAGNTQKKNKMHNENDGSPMDGATNIKELTSSQSSSVETFIVASQTLLRDGTKTGEWFTFLSKTLT
jgi:hypothetical protein